MGKFDFESIFLVTLNMFICIAPPIICYIYNKYDCKPSNLFAKIRYLNGDNYENYLKYLYMCGTCKYKVYRKEYSAFYKNDVNVMHCDLCGTKICNDYKCNYYKMRRCFKKYKHNNL